MSLVRLVFIKQNLLKMRSEIIPHILYCSYCAFSQVIFEAIQRRLWKFLATIQIIWHTKLYKNGPQFWMHRIWSDN